MEGGGVLCGNGGVLAPHTHAALTKRYCCREYTQSTLMLTPPPTCPPSHILHGRCGLVEMWLVTE